MKEPISPMLATLVGGPVQRKGWINEEKYDGNRALAYRRDDKVRLFSRNGKEITGAFEAIAAALAKLRGGDFVLDGEIVAFDREGVSRFQLLQRHDLDPRVLPVFTVFDCLEKDGKGMLREPLSRRRTAVELLIPPRHTVLMRARRLSPDGFAAFETAKQKGWEGIIAKDEASPYQPGKRSKSWLKVKCRRESEFVIGGFTAPEGHRKHFGALLVGLYAGARLLFVGKVGTGYSDETLAGLTEVMVPLRTSRCPFDPQPHEREASWVRPRLVAQVTFQEWTKDGKLRQSAFLGLRDDKAASECRWRERDR